MKAGDLQRVLEREPLNYYVERTNGSHRILEAEGRPRLVFAYHGGSTVPPGVVRKILVKDVGLDEETALGLIG